VVPANTYGPIGNVPANQDAATVGSVDEPAILNPVTDSAINPAGVGEPGRTARVAVREDVVAGLIRRRAIRGRPDGKGIIARAARSAIAHNATLHAHVDVDPIRDCIAEPAIGDEHTQGIGKPGTGFWCAPPRLARCSSWCRKFR